MHSPSARGEGSIHGLYLDWMRFVTDQTIDFMRHEVEAVRAFSDLPVTTNLMGSFYGLDSFRFARVLDFASCSSYPSWGETSDYSIALGAVSIRHHALHLEQALDFDGVHAVHGQLERDLPAQAAWHAFGLLAAHGGAWFG